MKSLDMNSMHTSVQKAMDSVKWAYGYQIIPKIIMPITYLILAKLLNPSVFGLIAIASLIISLVEMVRDTGFTRAFVQSDEDPKILFDTVFWISLSVGIFFYLAIVLASRPIASLFNNPESVWVIRIMGLQIILSSLVTCHNGTLLKNLEYRKMLKVNLLPAMSPLIFSVPLAYGGFGIWALIIGYLSEAVLRTIFLWRAVPIKPAFAIQKNTAKNILSFGLLSSLEALLGWFYVWGDRAIVGHYLDTTQLGIYTMASTVVTSLFSIIFAPLIILYPLFCQLRNDPEEIQSVLLKSFHFIAFLSLPVGISLYFISGFVALVFGPMWHGLHIPLGILAVASSLSYIVTVNIPDALRAINRPDIMPKFQTAKLLYTLPLYIIGVNLGGLEGFCYAKLGTVFIGFLLHIFLATSMLNLSLRRITRSFTIQFIAAIATVAILSLMRSAVSWGTHLFFGILSNIIICFIIYLIFFTLFDKKAMNDLIAFIRSALASDARLNR